MSKPSLFVPLKSEHFKAFAEGRKTVEYRRHGPRWNKRNITRGQLVTLSHGYSRERLSGVVTGLSLVLARDVPGASDIYPPDVELIAIRIKLDGRPPRLPRSARGQSDRASPRRAATAASERAPR